LNGEIVNRRGLLQFITALPLARHLWRGAVAPAKAATTAARSRARPGEPAWPSPADWDERRRDVGGRLIKPQSPLALCVDAPPALGVHFSAEQRLQGAGTATPLMVQPQNVMIGANKQRIRDGDPYSRSAWSAPYKNNQ
jgi:hypothetical protein